MMSFLTTLGKLVWVVVLGIGIMMPVVTPSFASTKKRLVFAADEWCPINCAALANKKGIAVDVLEKVFPPLGYEIQYKVMPWTRAVEAAEKNEIDGIIGAIPTDSKYVTFPKQDLVWVADSFFVRADSVLPYRDPTDILGQRIGVVSGYGYSEKVMTLLEKNKHVRGGVQFVSGEDAIAQNIRKLLAGRITVMVENKLVMMYMLEKMGKTDAVRVLGNPIHPQTLGISFAPKHKKNSVLVKSYEQAVQNLKRDGTLETILQKYNVGREDMAP